MKYITTDTHPELKEGIEIKYWENDSTWRTATTGLFRLTELQKDAELREGYIKELQEPEFTKDDMIEFAFWALSEQDNYEKETIKLDDWLNQRNK